MNRLLNRPKATPRTRRPWTVRRPRFVLGPWGALAALVLAILAASADAQQTREWPGQYSSNPGPGGWTSVTLGPPTTPLAVATITFRNSTQDGGRTPPEPFVLGYGDLLVGMNIVRGGGQPDIVTIDDLPEELMAVPHRLEIPDGGDGVIQIFPRDQLPVM